MIKKKQNNFKLIMISAMYENGGNTLQRFLDGHPNLYSYPFESQLGTNLVNDYLSSVFPVKYRWPVFSLEGTFDVDYELIIDEELKRHVKTPFASKFKTANVNLNDKERKEIFLKLLKNKKRSRKNIVEAFFRSTTLSWHNLKKSGKENTYVGYSPIVGVDADKIISDFPDCTILHIVRNPYSAYSDTKKRPVPYSLKKYIDIWNMVQLSALTSARLYPKNFYILRFEDLVANPKEFFTSLSKVLNIPYSKTMEYPSWNGRELKIMVPWGTIKKATTKDNIKTMKELSNEEFKKIKEMTSDISKLVGYDNL